MRTRVFSLISTLVVGCSPALAEGSIGSGEHPGAATGAAANLESSAALPSNAFVDLNRAFIKTYSGLAVKNLEATRPILIADGPVFKLMCEDGTTRTAPPPNPVENQLKTVSHMCAFMYGICDLHWRDPQSSDWKQSMTEAQQRLDGALSEVDHVSWESNAWPRGETKLKEFVRQSLTTAREFAATALKTGDVSKEEFRAFADKYLPTIRCTFYLNSLSSTYYLLNVIKQWRKDMGEPAWARMRVIISAGGGRSTAGLTKDTNPAAVIIGSLMTPENVQKHLLMAPAATNTEDALHGQALALTSYKLGDAAFKDNKTATWFYESLQHPDIPVALDPVRQAVTGLEKGNARDPILGLGP